MCNVTIPIISIINNEVLTSISNVFLFKMPMLAKHSNPLKMSVSEIQEGLPYFFINDTVSFDST